MDVNATTNQINAIKAAVERGKNDRVKAETNKENYEKRLTEVDAEITGLGFAPDNAEAEIEKLSLQIVNLVAEAKGKIPANYLQA